MKKRKKIIFLSLALILSLALFAVSYYIERQQKAQADMEKSKEHSITDKDFTELSNFHGDFHAKATVEPLTGKAGDTLTFQIVNTSRDSMKQVTPFLRLEKKIGDSWYYAKPAPDIVLETGNGRFQEPQKAVLRTLSLTEHEIPGLYRAVFRFQGGACAANFTVE